MKKSFSTRLSLNILLIVSILFIISLGVVAVSSHKLIADEATRSAQNILKATISEIEVPLNTIEVSTQAIAGIARYTFGDESQIQGLTCQAVGKNPLIVGCAIAFPKGGYQGRELFSPYCYRDSASQDIISINLGHDNYDFTQEEWFKVPFETKKPHWSNPYYDQNGGKQLMTTYSVPIIDEKGEVLAIVTADMPLQWMEDKVGSIRPYEHSFTSILCPDNTVIGIPDTALLQQGHEMLKNNQRVAAIIEEMKKGNDSVMRFANGATTYFTTFGPLHNGWSLSIICSYRDVLARSSQMHIILFFIGLIGLLIMFIICYRRIRRLTRPITELSDSALSMAKGNFNTQLPEITSEDEMLQLRDAFAFMQTSIKNYINELQTTTAANNRMEGELSVARDIQLGMLSHDFPANIHALLTPAKEVGGDLYDFMVKDGNLYFAIGDVSGKGAPAALLMAITRSALRFVVNLGLPLKEVMSRVNNSIAEANSNDMFVTLFIGRINLSTGHLQYCNAGHNPIIVITPDGDPYYLKAKANLAAGLFADFPYEEESLNLPKGSRLLLYTDGVSEAEDKDKAQYGDDRLLQWTSSSIAHNLDSEEKSVVDALYESVKDFTQDAPQNDDITIMSIKI